MRMALLLVCLLLVACVQIQDQKELPIAVEESPEEEVQIEPEDDYDSRDIPVMDLPNLDTAEEEAIEEVEELVEEVQEVVAAIPETQYVYQVVAFGDSLTAGYGLKDPEDETWVSLFTYSLRRADLYNYAISGATTYSVKDFQIDSFMDDASKDDIDEDHKLIILWIGANDIKKFFYLEDFEANYKEIVNELTDVPNSDLVIMTVPDASKLPVADEIEQDVNSWLQDYVQIEVNVKEIGKDVIDSYNSVIRKIAKIYGVPVIDMFSYMEELHESVLHEDQYHPNEKGHELIAKKVQEEIASIFPNLE